MPWQRFTPACRYTAKSSLFLSTWKLQSLRTSTHVEFFFTALFFPKGTHSYLKGIPIYLPTYLHQRTHTLINLYMYVLAYVHTYLKNMTMWYKPNETCPYFLASFVYALVCTNCTASIGTLLCIVNNSNELCIEYG